MSTANKLTYLNGTKQAIKQAINEDFEVIDNNTTFREYADEISSNNAKYKDLIPKETKNATNTLDISNSAGLDKALVTQYGNTYQEGEPTPDSPQEIQVVTGDNTIIVSNSDNTQSQSYHVSLGNIELCKIENYKDKIAKSTGKNLLSWEFILGSIDSYGRNDGRTDRARTGYMSLKENTTYSFSSTNSSIYYVPYYYNSSQTFISYDNGWKPQTTPFTTPANTKYVRLIVKNNNTNTITLSEITNPMLNEGSTALPYEPYGKVWYLNKQIGKVVLDGSENWNNFNIEPSGLGRAMVSSSNVYYNSTQNTIMANNMVGVKYSGSWNNAYDCIATLSNNRFISYLKNASDLSTFKSILSNSNSIVYYVLATPTTTEITENNYPTLYNQLNNIKLFEGVNHITMTNESGLDVEFDITYYKDWKLD